MQRLSGALHFAVILDSHDLNGTTLALTGSVQGTMGPSDTHGNNIDLSQGQAVEGTFKVAVEELE